MFAFSQIDPETRGQVTDMEVPMSKYLRASMSQGLHDSIYAQWWRLNERWAEERDDSYPLLTVEEVKKNYGIDTKEPMRENIAMMLQSQHQAQAERDYLLANDNHSILAAGLGMSATMLASMLNPVDLALMFVPIVGQETKLAAGANALGRGRAALRTGLVTRETLQFMVPKAPKLAESVIQGGAYMVAYEALNQPLAILEHRDAGNPIVNIAAGTAIAAGFHGVVTALSRLLFGLPIEVQKAAVHKAADDVAKGKPIDVTDVIKSTEAFAKQQVAVADIDVALPQTKVDFAAFQEKVRTIFRNKLNQLRQEVLPGKQPKPVVPATAAEYERTAFTSVLDEIRQRGLRTKEQIQKAFPEAQLSREEAAVLRREAWGEQEVKKQHTDNLLEIIEKVKAQQQPAHQMSLKRKARMDAERNMPNPFKDDADLESHLNSNKNPEKRVTKINEEIKELEKKLEKQQPETVIGPDKLEYKNTPKIQALIERAQKIVNRLPEIKEGFTRLWRGNRPDEIGKNPSFTKSLVGIALPFEESYKGGISYVDVPTSKLKEFETPGGSPGDEFILPKELAEQAQKAKETKPRKKPVTEKVATDNAIRELHKGWEGNELTPKDIAESLLDTLKGKRGYGELLKAAKKYLKELEEDLKMWGGKGNQDEAAEEAFMDLLDEYAAITDDIADEAKLTNAQTIAKDLGVRYDGQQTWFGQSPTDVYTMMDKKNPFTVYVPEGSPKEVVEAAFKKKVAENTPMPKAIETATDCVTKALKQLPLV